VAHIDYYFTAVSPFCYLAGLRLEEMAARHGATITCKPVDMTALFARTEGVALPDRPDCQKASRLQEIRRQATKRVCLSC